MIVAEQCVPKAFGAATQKTPSAKRPVNLGLLAVAFVALTGYRYVI